MGGFFGIVSDMDCVRELFYGTDYHSHLGNLRGGMMTMGINGIRRVIHDISSSPFRPKFREDLPYLEGATSGIGCISDTGDQPLIIRSHLGTYGVTMVGAINNLNELTDQICQDKNAHFSEIGTEGINPNEVAAAIVASGETLAEGIVKLQNTIEGSCSMLILAEEGIYAVRDGLGRTPVFVGRNNHAQVVAFEPCALYNLGYTKAYELKPGEAVLVTKDSITQIVKPRSKMQICAFLWVYYGFPASSYEGKTVETVRYACGEMLAKADAGIQWGNKPDMVVGIPDSGVAHALGYAHGSDIPYKRAFIKYTPTWARSFIPKEQSKRAHVASMKLLPVEELIKDKNLVFCEDSIVRGTQLGNTMDRLRKLGVNEVHVRSACPPILFNCKYINFSRSQGLSGLAARRAIARIENHTLTGNVKEDDQWFNETPLDDYLDPTTEKYKLMIEEIRKELNLTSVSYQTLDDLIAAIGLPKECICTYCWDGCDVSKPE